MIITSWNIRCLNSRGKQRYLKERLKKDKPSIMIIHGTKINKRNLKKNLENFKPQYQVMDRDANGSAGGFAILWNPREIMFDEWISLPKILSGGDFNMVTSLVEKKGGRRRKEDDMEAFGDIIEELHVVDLPMMNGVYKWNNRRGGSHQITSRLDRYLISEQAISKDIFMEASILPCMGLDH
eukprot:PITA_27563